MIEGMLPLGEELKVTRVVIDALLKSMNYAPVPAGTNSNNFVGKGASSDAGQSSMEMGYSQDYILMPLWKDNSLFNSSSQALNGHNKDKHGPSQASESDNQKRPNAKSSTKTVNTTRPINTATPTYVNYPNDPLMLGLEDAGILNDAYDDRDESVEADYNNLEIVISVSPIPFTRIHKDHPKEHIIGEVESMHEELLQFKLLNVWTLVDLPLGKRAIGTKWVYRNKRDQRGIVVRNKARLVDQQKDGIFLSQDKYVSDILKKFGFSSVKSASTLMETYKPLSKDATGIDVDVHLYRFMIGSLMYLTSSRPDIMFVVCTCSRFQVQPKVYHMHAVKRLFRYLKGQPILGLWYPKDSHLELIAYSDNDYAVVSLDIKSITGGCQFFGSRLIFWQCKKQTIMANSTTKAEYIAASNYRGQVLWLQNQLLDYGYNFKQTKIHVDNESAIYVVKNHVYHSKTKHIEIWHHFIRDSYEKSVSLKILSRTRKSSAPSPKHSIPSRSHTSTRHKGNEIAKTITPLSETASEEDNDSEQAQRDKDMQKNLALIAKYFKKIYKPTNNNLRTSSNTKNKNVDTTPRYMAKIQEVPNADSGTDSEPVEQVQNNVRYNVFANELQHSDQSEYVSNTCLVETDDSNVTPNSLDMCKDDIQNEQNNVESDDERVALANLKLNVDENKKMQKQLKKANTTLAQ
nr:hypothetical protein [Tanacetum cinerariifolium]